MISAPLQLDHRDARKRDECVSAYLVPHELESHSEPSSVAMFLYVLLELIVEHRSDPPFPVSPRQRVEAFAPAENSLGLSPEGIEARMLFCNAALTVTT